MASESPFRGTATLRTGELLDASPDRAIIALSPSPRADMLRGRYGELAHPPAESGTPSSPSYQAAPDRDGPLVWLPPPSSLLAPSHPDLAPALRELAAAVLRVAAMEVSPAADRAALGDSVLGWARWAEAAGVDLEMWAPLGDPTWASFEPGPVATHRCPLPPPPAPSPRAGSWLWAPAPRASWGSWFAAVAAPAILAERLRCSEVHILLHGPAAAMLHLALTLPVPGAPSRVVVILRWDQLLPPAVQPPRLISPPAYVPPSAPHSLRICGRDNACPVCEAHDALYAAAAMGPAVPPHRAMAFAHALRCSPDWWPHQAPELVPLEDDSTPDPRDPGPASHLIPLILVSLAAAPPPPVARVFAPTPFCGGAPGAAMDWTGPERPSACMQTPIPLPLSARSQAVMSAVSRGLAYGWLDPTPRLVRPPSMLAFAVAQGDKFRVCVDPAEVNDLVLPAPTRYSRPGDLLAFPQASCAGKLDVKSAFLSLQILPADRPYLAVHVAGVPLTLTRLWFGLRSGPRDFQAVMADATAPCRAAMEHPAAIVAYMDDVSPSASTPAASSQAVLGLLVAFLAGGLLPAVQKCHYRAASTVRFLGTLVDFTTRTLRVAPSAARRALLDVRTLLATSAVGPLAPSTAELLRSLLGRLAFFASALPSLSPFVAGLRAASAAGVMSPSALAECELLSDWLPTISLDSHDRAPSWPVLVVVCDAAQSGAAGATGGAISIMLGGDESSRGIRFSHLDLARSFPAEALSHSYGFELATLALAIEEANATTQAFGSVFSLTDAASVAASLAAAPPSVRRAQAEGQAVGAIQRFQTRGEAAAATMARLLAALRRPGTREIRFLATAHHPRASGAAKVADAWSDAAGRVASLHASAAATVRAVAGPMDLDLAARSASSALSAAWCVVGSGDDGRAALLHRSLAAARGARHEPWPDMPSVAHLHAAPAAWLLAWGGAFGRWRAWLTDALPGFAGVLWCADVLSSPTLATLAQMIGPPRWFFTIPLSAGPVVEPDVPGSRPAAAWGCTLLAVAAFASATAWAAWLAASPSRSCNCSRLPARAGWSSPAPAPRRVCHCVSLRTLPWDDRTLSAAEAAVAWVRGGRCRGDGPDRLAVQSAPFIIARGRCWPVSRPMVVWPDGRTALLTTYRRRLAGDRGEALGSSDRQDRADAALDAAAASAGEDTDADFVVDDDAAFSPDRTPPGGPSRVRPQCARRRSARASPAWRNRQRLLAARAAALAMRAAARSSESGDSSDSDWTASSATSSPSPAISASPSPRAPRRPAVAIAAARPGPLSSWRARRPGPPGPPPSAPQTATAPPQPPAPPAAPATPATPSPPLRAWSVPSTASPSPMCLSPAAPPVPQGSRPTAADEARLAVTRSGRCPGDNPVRPRSWGDADRTPPASRAAVTHAPLGVLSPATALAHALGVASPPRHPSLTLDLDRSPATPPWAAAPRPPSPPRHLLRPPVPLSPCPVLGQNPAAEPDPAHPWPPLPCAQCGVIVPPHSDARLCDTGECAGWLVCRTCAPATADPVPLLCPRHQLAPPAAPCPSVDVRDALSSSTTGTVGRWLLRLVALALGWPPSALRPWPLFPADAAPTPLDGLVDGGRAAMWTDARQESVRGTLLRMHALMAAVRASELPAAQAPRLAEGYVVRRLEAPMSGWRPALPRTVAAELSAVAAASRTDSLLLPPFCGPAVRALLLHRGGMERPEHTRAYPLTLQPLWAARQHIPPRLHTAHRALCFQILLLLRAGMPGRIRRGMLRRCGPGWILAWRRRTKVRRGDRTAADPVMAPQVSAASGPVIEWIMAGSPPGDDDLIFPGLEHADTVALLRLIYKDVPPDFVLRPHGGRSGGDAILQVLRVPSDVIDTQAWWTRPRRSSGYYGCLCLDVFFAATAIMHLVVLQIVAPGMVRFVGLEDGRTVPDWERMRLSTSSLSPLETPPALDSLSDSSDDGARVAVVSAADAAAWSARAHPTRARRPHPVTRDGIISR